MKSDLLIPVRKIRKTSGEFKWPSSAVLCSPFSEDHLPLSQLKKTLKEQIGTTSRLSRNYQKNYDLVVRRHSSFNDMEGYSIEIAPDGIEILAPTSTAAYYAVQTLRELVRVNGRSIPCCRIDDAPDFRRRGIYLDCSRGKVPTVDTLKLLVEYLASMKINELQLYVENVFTFKKHPAIGRGFSSFTPEELLAVQDHCKLHHVSFVPSLTSFGHFEKILRLPEYEHLAEVEGAGTLCPTDPGSIKLVADMYSEFLPLFEADDFNACGDEPWVLGKGRSKRRADKVGVGRVYIDFVKKLHKLCEKHGKRMNLWSDIVLNHPEVIADIPPDIVMLNWDYNAKGSRIPRTHEFVDAGLDVVVCPGTNCWSSHGTRLQTAIDNVSVFAKEGRKQHADGLLNTDWGDGGNRNPIGSSFHGYAHGAAHSWNGAAVDDGSFTETFCYHVLGTTSKRVVKLVRDLGAVEELTDVKPYHVNGVKIEKSESYPLKLSPVSPVLASAALAENADLTGTRKVLRSLSKSEDVVRSIKKPGTVARLVLEDLELAAELDKLGCSKLTIMDRCRNGKAVEAAEYRAIERMTIKTAKMFERNWLARNKMSRLKDNMKIFTAGQRELAKLGKK